MPDPTRTVTMVNAEGVAIGVPESDVALALSQGYRVEGAEANVARVEESAAEDRFSGFRNALEAGVTSALNSATAGGFDVATGALLGEDYSRRQSALRDYQDTASTIGNIAGAVAPALATGGTSIGARALAATPAGLIAKLGTRVAGAGAELGSAGRLGATILGGATEGALQNTGSYISDVALGRKELAADSFMGAMGQGALWGGGASGALSIGARGVTALRSMVPEATKEAAEIATREAVESVSKAARENVDLITAAKNRMAEIRLATAEFDLAKKAQLDEIAINKSREIADAQIASAQARSEAQIARAQAPRGRKSAVVDAVDVAPAVVDDAATALERQLLGTKKALDAGQELGAISRARPQSVEDAMNAHLAKTDPEMATLVRAVDEAQASSSAVDAWVTKYGKNRGGVDSFERSEASRATADSWRSKDRYQTSIRGGDHRADLKRGQSSVWRGSDEARALADERTLSKVPDRAEIDAAVDEMFPRRSIADEIVDGADAKAATTADDKIADAVGHKQADLDDVSETIDTVSRMEAAQADLVEALGPRAPASAQARAAELRAAQKGAEDAGVQQAADLVDDAQRAADGVASKPGMLRGAYDKAMSAGTYLEALQAIGVSVPDPGRIPVIGPLLSLVLKAKAIGRFVGRGGGVIPKTAESVIASKAAAMQARVFRAVDGMLEGTAKGMTHAAGVAGGPAAALGSSLFKSRESPAEKPKGDDLGSLFLARSEEINNAAEPGAIRQAVRERVRASDPALVDAITVAMERKLGFLGEKMPRPGAPAGLLEGQRPWIPSKEAISKWSRYVEAAENPALVLERVADGGTVSGEAIETLRKVYPELYATAQDRLITKAAEKGSEVPANRRAVLSVLFDLPTSRATEPGYLSFLQEGYKAKATPPAPPMPGSPPTPTISGDVNLGAAYAPDNPLGV